MNWFNALKERMSGGGVKAGSGATASDNKESKESGFTIVEVMIVLAIAGLVLGIVFIAVPALQRNSRNTQRKADIGILRGAISSFESSNNGALPEAADAPGLTAEGTGSKLGFYTVGAVAQVQSGTLTQAAKTVYYFNDVKTTEVTTNALANLPIPDAVYVLQGVKCRADKTKNGTTSNEDIAKVFDQTAGAEDIVAGSSRTYAVVYQLEGADNATCEDNA